MMEKLTDVQKEELKNAAKMFLQKKLIEAGFLATTVYDMVDGEVETETTLHYILEGLAKGKMKHLLMIDYEVSHIIDRYLSDDGDGMDEMLKNMLRIAERIVINSAKEENE